MARADGGDGRGTEELPQTMAYGPEPKVLARYELRLLGHQRKPFQKPDKKNVVAAVSGGVLPSSCWKTE